MNVVRAVALAEEASLDVRIVFLSSGVSRYYSACALHRHVRQYIPSSLGLLPKVNSGFYLGFEQRVFHILRRAKNSVQNLCAANFHASFLESILDFFLQTLERSDFDHSFLP